MLPRPLTLYFLGKPKFRIGLRMEKQTRKKQDEYEDDLELDDSEECKKDENRKDERYE